MIDVSPQVKLLLSPRWIALHLIVVIVSVTMVLLGRWQLTVSDDKHFDLQNFGYALQWWAFTAFGLVMWFRAVRDTTPKIIKAHRESDVARLTAEFEPVKYRRYLMPQSASSPAAIGDGLHAAYNDYLAQIARADQDRGDTARRALPDAAVMELAAARDREQAARAAEVQVIRSGLRSRPAELPVTSATAPQASAPARADDRAGGSAS